MANVPYFFAFINRILNILFCKSDFYILFEKIGGRLGGGCLLTYQNSILSLHIIKYNCKD